MSGGGSVDSLDSLDSPDSPDSLDLDPAIKLRIRILACRACPLAVPACTAPVPISGHLPSRSFLACLAEAPGEQEDLMGIPLVGPSGSILDSALGACGLDRSDVPCMNVVSCRPLSSEKQTVREPDELEKVACRELLEEQLKLSGPAVVLALGLHATHALGLSSSERGTLCSTLSFGFTVIPTWHPSPRNMRRATRLREFRDHVCEAARVAWLHRTQLSEPTELTTSWKKFWDRDRSNMVSCVVSAMTPRVGSRHFADRIASTNNHPFAIRAWLRWHEAISDLTPGRWGSGWMQEGDYGWLPGLKERMCRMIMGRTDWAIG